MFIFKNAWISITRNKGRNVLIGIIILVIACATTITLAINNTADDLIGSYQSAYDKELTISFNRQKMTKDFDFSNREKMEEMKNKFSGISTYSVEDVEKFGESELIESYYYTYNIGLNGNNIEKVESENSDASGRGAEAPGGFPGGAMDGFPGGMGGRGGVVNASSLDFTLNGYSSVEAMSEFIEGKYEMVEIADDAWEKAFSGKYVFVNEELAEYNSLGLGDKIKLEDEDGNVYKFEIVGIYQENDADEMGNFLSMFSNSANTIITNADTLIEIAHTNENVQGTVEATFIIYDYSDAEKIEKEFYDKGLNENYSVSTNEEVATAGLSSIKNVKSFVTMFLIITLGIGGMILLIINMINIRERKYEIGVLRTIGISKAKLTMQFVAELMMVGVVALAIGAGAGAVMSKSASNSLLASEISSSQASQEKMKNNFGGGPGGFGPMGGKMDFKEKGALRVEAYESIDAVVSVGVILELLGIGLGLILISSLASMISIQRFSPLTILKERS